MNKSIVASLLILAFSQYSVAQFGNQNNLNSNINPYSVVTADLDNDLDDDIIYLGNESLVWNENLGEGNFSQPRIVSSNILTWYVLKVADLDGDGLKDLLSSENGLSDNEIVWYKNNGNGDFSEALLIGYIYDGNPRSIDVGDADGDGLLDVLVINSSDNGIIIFRNLGGAMTWSENHVIPGVISTWSGQFQDMDNDGDLDLLINFISGGVFNSVKWYENYGDGTYNEWASWLESDLDFPYCTIYADLDEDGLKDIISTSADSDDKIIWNKNIGGGDYADLQVITTDVNEARAVIAADLDGDGDLDVASVSKTDAKIAMYDNLGGGVFGMQEVISDEIPFPTGIASSDLDGDGDFDLVVSFNENVALFEDFNDRVAWFENLGGGTFADYQYIAINTFDPRDISLADLDGDGQTDVLTTDYFNDVIVWYKNVGNSNFQIQNLITADLDEPESVAANDFDNDGDQDIAVAQYSGDEIAWIENLGDETFGAKHVLSEDIIDCRNVKSLDFDNDGDYDIFGTTHYRIILYRNLGGGEFMSGIEIANILYGSDYELADFNNDGIIDLFYTNDAKIYFRKGNGGSFFLPVQITATAPGVRDIYIEDLNGDGFKDVLANCIGSEILEWYENLGDGTFGPQQIISTDPINKGEVHAADFDEDGDIDIAVGRYDADQLFWLENIDNEYFADGTVLSSDNNEISKILSHDFDLDGDEDLIMVANFDNTVSIYENYLYSPSQIRGVVYIDADEDGERDSTEVGAPFVQVISDPTNSFSYVYGDGKYFLNLDISIEGMYEISTEPLSYWAITSDSLVYHVNVNDVFTFEDSIDFGIYPDTIVDEIGNKLTGGFPRCNSRINYWLNVNNLGTTFPSGLIHLELDENIEYHSAAIEPDSINGQNLYWHYDSLNYFDHHNFDIQVDLPGADFIGETFTSYLITTIDSTDGTVFTASDSLIQELVCAYDPNDKIAFPVGEDDLGYVPSSTEELTYTIRFQNTGTDTAINVVIKDKLDINLKWETLQPLAWSDSMEVDILPSGYVFFTFPNIMLPDSNANEIESHGFVTFSISIKDDLILPVTIANNAQIYFDENPAINTNTKLNTLICIENMEITLEDEMEETLCLDYGDVTLISNIDGTIFSGVGVAGSIFSTNDAGYGEHVIYGEAIDGFGCTFLDSITVSIVDCLSLPDSDSNIIRIYPNPFSDYTTIHFNENQINSELIIYNLLGDIVFKKEGINGNTLIFTNEDLTAGMYILSIVQEDDNSYQTKLIVK